MKYREVVKVLAMVVMLALAACPVSADRLTGHDWTSMTRDAKMQYLTGYVDGRISEIVNSGSLTTGSSMTEFSVTRLMSPLKRLITIVPCSL